MAATASPAAPRLASAQAFAAVRDFLLEADFTEEAVCARLGLTELELQALRAVPPASGTPADALELIARLFVAGDAFVRSVAEKLLPTGVFEALFELGLLAPWTAASKSSVCATAALYPVGGVWIASDRWNHPDRAPYASFGEIVYPAISPNTRRFLELLPPSPCGNFLDLCSGTGVAALIAARGYAKHAWAADLTERCTAFTEFNRRLNGLDNVTVVQGDLYEPVRGISFDRIVAHPPYMPTLQTAEIFYDGGQDGEFITGRILQHAPAHLAPGGRLYCLTMGSDRKRESFEQRIRRWLGDAGRCCNVGVIAQRFVNPSQFALSSALQAGRGTPEADQWKAYFRERGIRSLVYGMVVVERAAEDAAAFTVRRAIGAESATAETEWLLRWEAAAKREETIARLLEERPRATPQLELRVTHRMREGDLVPAEFQLSTEYPFSLECAVPAWTGYLLAACDGSRSGRELLAWCKGRGLLHPETPEEEFARFLAMLVSGGFVETAICPLPKR